MLHQFIARIGAQRRAPRRSRLERRADRLLRARRRVRLRQRARRLLRAAGRVVPHGRAGARVCRHRRAGDDGRRRRALYGQGPDARGRADQRDRRRSPLRIASSTASTPRSIGSRRRDFGGTLLGFVDQVLASPRTTAPAGGVRFLGSGRTRRRARGDQGIIGQRRFTRCRRSGDDDRQPVGARRRTGATRSATRRAACAGCCATWGTSPISMR